MRERVLFDSSVYRVVSDAHGGLDRSTGYRGAAGEFLEADLPVDPGPTRSIEQVRIGGNVDAMPMDSEPQVRNDDQRPVLADGAGGAVRTLRGSRRYGKSWDQERQCALLLEAFPHAQVEEVRRNGLVIKTIRAEGKSIAFVRRDWSVKREAA
jgi:hypothetical protein